MAAPQDIFQYLPQSYKNKSEEDYINFLWESFEVNYKNEKYPFAFIAYHMLYMSFVYFEVWQIKEASQTDFEKAMVGFSLDNENGLMRASTPFAFWKINESSFFRFLKLLNCGNDRIGNYATIVKARNEAAHSNGNIFFNSQASVDTKINDVLRFIDEIQTLSQPIIESCLIGFLKDSWNPDEREYLDDQEQIQEVLIHGNYLSQKDIEQMLTFNINLLSAEPNFIQMKSLFDSFISNYS
jgi:Trp operon repressor